MHKKDLGYRMSIDRIEKQWKKTIGGNDKDNLRNTFQTLDGGFILGGYSTSGLSGDKTDNSKGNSDYWIVKLDSYKMCERPRAICHDLNVSLNSNGVVSISPSELYHNSVAECGIKTMTVSIFEFFLLEYRQK